MHVKVLQIEKTNGFGKVGLAFADSVDSPPKADSRSPSYRFGECQMVSMLDLPNQYFRLQPEIDAAVQRVLRSGQFVLGEEVERFEADFAAYCGTKYAVAVNSGTSALHLSLVAAGVGPGDEVITVSFTFVATVAAILYSGARPVFVDIEPRSFTLDVEQLESVISSRTRAVLPVHLYGQAADMNPIRDFARKHGLAVIEDASQAHGATYQRQRVGSFGDFGCFSFYPGKNLGAYGEGGCVTTNDESYARLMRMLRDWGCEHKYHHELHGFNYRMDALQAAVLHVKLPYLDGWNDIRQHHALTYRELLSESPVILPDVMPQRQHVYHVFAIRTPERDLLQRQLRALDIQTGIHYPTPVHLQPAYKNLGWKPGSLPESERAAREELSLPIDPGLSTYEIQQISWNLANSVCTTP